MTTAPILHGGGVTQAIARFGGTPDGWLDLSTGINPNPVELPAIPQSAWHRLPDAHLVDTAQQAAAAYYRSGRFLPLPVPGTQSVIQCLPGLVSGQRPVAVVAPTYGEYARVFRARGFHVDEIFSLDDVSADHGLVVIVNPNNPTGRAYQPADLLALATRLNAQGASLLVDEAFCDSQPELSTVPFAKDHDNLIVFRSFGKFFGLAGLRLGFVIASPEVLALFQEALGPWAVSGPALVAASVLLRGDTASIQRAILERKAALDAVLSAAGLVSAGGTSLFTLVETEHAERLREKLCQAHILTRRFSFAPHWLRIGLCPDEASDRRLAQALKQSVAGRLQAKACVR